MSYAPKTAYLLPPALRARLAKPFGPIVQTGTLADALEGAGAIVAVGDVVSMTLHELGIEPSVFVCDYKTQRGEDDPGYRRVLGSWGDRERCVVNPAAQVTREAWLAVRDGLADEGITRIVVDGEEDLLGLPAFLEAPLGSAVLYGMPGQGIVVVPVTREVQATVAAIVADMDEA